MVARFRRVGEGVPRMSRFTHFATDHNSKIDGPEPARGARAAMN